MLHYLLRSGSICERWGQLEALARVATTSIHLGVLDLLYRLRCPQLRDIGLTIRRTVVLDLWSPS